MPNATTPTSIVNAALAELGSITRVATIDDPIDSKASSARAIYDQVLRDLTYRHPWNFAIRRRLLNAAASGAEYGFTNAYTLPEDCVRWLPPSRDGGYPGESGDWFEGEREGDLLITNASAPLAVRYIALIEDTSKFPPGFVRAFTFGLAAALAEGVTSDESIKDRLEERFERAVIRAKRMDGLESGPRSRRPRIFHSDILQGRRFGLSAIGRG